MSNESSLALCMSRKSSLNLEFRMQRFRQLSSFTFASLCLLAGATACKDDAVAPPTPAAITPVGQASFTSLVGEVQSVRVLVTDASARPMANQTVTFNVVDGGGTIAPTSTTTAANGEASATWTLGTTTGLQRAQAQVTGVSGALTFIATALPGAPATVAVSAGDNQSAPAGSMLGTSPAVVIKDRFGNAVQNVSVFFTVTSGGGSVTASGATTNNAGIATAAGWRLGAASGVNRLTALALVNGATGNPVVFTANGLAGSASSLSALSATTQTGTVGTTVSSPPSVRLVDAGGNPVAGSQVTFQGSAGSSVTGAIKLTDANGVATADSWQLGTAAQAYTLTVTSGALTPVVFSATARASAPASVTANAGNLQSVIVGRPVPIEPSVRVTDGFGNPVPGLEVVFEVVGGGGVAVARRPVTNANGIAEVGGWTLGDVVGQNSLRATVNAGGAIIANNPIIFSATATAAPPASLLLSSAGGQSAIIGSALLSPISVIVRDNRGNPASGVSVSFFVQSGGGALTGSTPVTNASGIATLSSWTLGPSVGTQTILARVSGLPDLIISATGIAVTPASASALTVLDLGTFAVGTLATPAPSVIVRDASGNPVTGAVVTFTPEAGSSSVLTGAVQTTGADGIATLATWNVGTVGSATLRVRAFVAGLDQLGAEPTFIARTSGGTASAMQVAPGAVLLQAGTALAAVTTLPAVRVVDVQGNPIVGVAVTFVGSAGTVTGAAQVTNANGVAQVGGWTLPAGGAISHTMTAYLVSNATIQLVFTVTVP